MPDKKGMSPSYEEKSFPREEKLNRLLLIASPDARDGSMWINQDVSVYASILEPGKTVSIDLADNRHAWIQVASGSIAVGSRELNAGDGVAISDETTITIEAQDEAEFLLFDLA